MVASIMQRIHLLPALWESEPQITVAILHGSYQLSLAAVGNQAEEGMFLTRRV